MSPSHPCHLNYCHQMHSVSPLSSHSGICDDLLTTVDLHKLFSVSFPSRAFWCPQTPQVYYQVRAFSLVSSPLNALNHILLWLMISAQIVRTPYRHSLNIQSGKKVLNPIHIHSSSSSFFQSWSLIWILKNSQPLFLQVFLCSLLFSPSIGSITYD